MRKFLSALFFATLFGAVLALGLPSQGEVIVVASDGTVVGVGELKDGKLDLEIVSGFNDFATLTVVDTDGNVVSVDVLIGAGGSITLSDTLEDLGAVMAASGGSVEVEFEESLAGELAEEAAEEAEEAAERAAEEAEEAAEEAEEATEEAEEAAEEAEEAAGESDDDDSDDDSDDDDSDDDDSDDDDSDEDSDD